MTVINNTSSTITILAKELNPTEIKPNESFDVFSRMFDGISIHSDDGSCIIHVTYGKREYQCFGNIVLKEDGPVKVNVFVK